MKNIILNFFFPKQCISCTRNGSYLCPTCFHSRTRLNLFQKCLVCGGECRLGLVHSECKDSTFLDGLIYVCIYDKFIKDLIQEGKYNSTFWIFKEFGVIMSQYLDNYYKNRFQESILVPIPLHKSKLRKRGFNQAEILSKEISKKLNLKSVNLLRRNRKTKTQFKLDEKSRGENLLNAFEFENLKEFLIPRSVILVDDIFTTGSTLSNCAKVLKEKGVREVYGFVMAKARG